MVRHLGKPTGVCIGNETQNLQKETLGWSRQGWKMRGRRSTQVGEYPDGWGGLQSGCELTEMRVPACSPQVFKSATGTAAGNPRRRGTWGGGPRADRAGSGGRKREIQVESGR